MKYDVYEKDYADGWILIDEDLDLAEVPGVLLRIVNDDRGSAMCFVQHGHEPE